MLPERWIDCGGSYRNVVGKPRVQVIFPVIVCNIREGARVTILERIKRFIPQSSSARTGMKRTVLVVNVSRHRAGGRLIIATRVVITIRHQNGERLTTLQHFLCIAGHTRTGAPWPAAVCPGVILTSVVQSSLQRRGAICFNAIEPIKKIVTIIISK